MFTLFDKPFFVLGHRGYSEKFPENTILSFSECKHHPLIDGVELDVHLCKSGEVVVAHDSNLSRIAGIDKNIEDMNWDELKDIDVGSFKGEEFSFCRMPLLSQVFDTFGSSYIYDIELKTLKNFKYRKLCDKVWSLICAYSLEENVMVSSFNPLALRFFNKICMMSVPTADIFCNSQKGPAFLKKGYGRFISNSSFAKPDYKSINDKYIKKNKLDLITWTVNTKQEAQEILKVSAVKGLIGNNPYILAECMEKIKK